MDQPDGPLINDLRRFSSRPCLKPLLGYAIAAACLVWVFHDVHAGRLLQQIVAIDWRWVLLAILFDVLSYLCQGIRWRLLLRPVGHISIMRATQAVYAGLFVNEVLPMRLGEFVRAYLVARWLRTKLSKILPSMVVERLFDGIWLALGIALAAIYVPLPRNLLEAGDVLGVILLIATAFFIYVIFRRESSVTVDPIDMATENVTIRAERSAPTTESAWQPFRFLASHIGRLASGLRVIGWASGTYTALAVSLLLLALQALAFWLVMIAYGLPLSFFAGAVIFLIVHLGTALPNAPANIGSYQFFTVVGLTIFGVEKTSAAGFSVVVFTLLSVPLWIIGSLAFSRSGATLFAVRDEIRKSLRERKR